MVSRITRLGSSYYQAIDRSAWTARQGRALASNAIAFCDRLILGKDTLETLQRGLQDTMQIGTEAHAGSKTMIAEFRDVRTRLFKACRY